MALTPEDVVNKRFQPTKFREGYDQDEVDDFLDEVVVELRRLNQENEELRQRLLAADSQRPAAPAPAAAPAFAQPEPIAPAPSWGQQAEATPTWGQPADVAPAAAPVWGQPAEAPAPAPAFAQPEPVAAAPVPAPAPADSLDPTNTNNLLQLARRLHEEHVREGVEKRDALIAEGHATAARIVSEAEQAQARITAEASEAQARITAETEQNHRAQLSAFEIERTRLEQERTSIELNIEELRTFEHEYRLKLKSYIEGQLRELEDNGAAQSAPAASPEPAYAAPAAESAAESVDQNTEQSGEEAPAPAGYFGDNQYNAPAQQQQQPPVNFTGFGSN